MEALLTPTPAAQSTQRLLKEEAEEECIGGMRRPARSLSRLPKARALGARIAWEFSQCCMTCPEALTVGAHFGDPSYAGASDEVILAWRRVLRLTLQAGDEHHTTPLLGPPSGDPEAPFIKTWVYEGVPLRRALEIPTAGIFHTSST
eukprot:4422180-Amphidinium_carterae.1